MNLALFDRFDPVRMMTGNVGIHSKRARKFNRLCEPALAALAFLRRRVLLPAVK